MKLEDLTPHEKKFLEAYRLHPELSEQVDKALGISVNDMSEEEFGEYIVRTVFEQAIHWVAFAPEDELSVPRQPEDATIAEKIYAWGINVVAFGFMKGADFASAILKGTSTD